MLLAALPLLYPPIPPPGGPARSSGPLSVELDLAASPSLQQYYEYHWAAIGNLGVDLWLCRLGKLIGLEPAAKLIVLAIPPFTVAGFLWVAREVHGRISPTALFALPFAYNHPFLYGFVNYALAMALALLAFAFWLRLGRLGQTRLRAILFVPISVIIFFCHTYGWGVLGLLCFSGEAVRQHDSGQKWIKGGVIAALHASVMALPALIMLAWRSDAQGGSAHGWFLWSSKWEWVYSALRDRWSWFDMTSVAIVALVFTFALFSGGSVSHAISCSRRLYCSPRS